MIDLLGLRICVLDLETANSADDCRHCGRDLPTHYDMFCGPPQDNSGQTFMAIGWDSKPALGLSIGCYYDYRDSRMHWFDLATLEETIQHFVETQPLLVSFNGISFDFPLMRGLLRWSGDELETVSQRTGFTLPQSLVTTHGARMLLCDTFKAQCATSYDILAEIWKVKPDDKFQSGLNSLDAISKANGLGAKLSHGAQAPRDWRDGQYAKVLNYCQDDVLKTKALFEMICQNDGVILRGDGSPIFLALPSLICGLREE